jgi:hypothetical protein
MFLSPTDAERGPKEITYPDEPLQQNEIRLVTLQPGVWTDPIECGLSNVRLDGARYRTLSYVWGSRNVTRQIRLNGNTYPVTVNLESALRYLRTHYPEGLVVWIDALCINQGDVEERTQQVQLMGTIYKRCEEVIVYLEDSLEDGSSRTEAPKIRGFGGNPVQEEDNPDAR